MPVWSARRLMKPVWWSLPPKAEPGAFSARSRNAEQKAARYVRGGLFAFLMLMQALGAVCLCMIKTSGHNRI
ncbi:hypothetical protein AA0473_1324 [Acetobacter orleanensis NRIC 0473]|nr:hypothetical protein AA0473_1324 [Acetobacter orleanensis NRIC 0473]